MKYIDKVENISAIIAIISLVLLIVSIPVTIILANHGVDEDSLIRILLFDLRAITIFLFILSAIVCSTINKN